MSLMTTLLAAGFGFDLMRRWAKVPGRRHLLWWGLGVVLYGLGTGAAAHVERFGWSPAAFRIWYTAGAVLGGAILALGTVHLHHRAETASQIVRTVGVVAAGCTLAVMMSPVAPLPSGDLAGASLGWGWVRIFTPFLNVFAVTYLAGGAIRSGWQRLGGGGGGTQVAGNALLALGAITPALGGVASRLGGAAALPPTLLVGLVLIWVGARLAGRPRG